MDQKRFSGYAYAGESCRSSRHTSFLYIEKEELSTKTLSLDGSKCKPYSVILCCWSINRRWPFRQSQEKDWVSGHEKFRGLISKLIVSVASNGGISITQIHRQQSFCMLWKLREIHRVYMIYPTQHSSNPSNPLLAPRYPWVFDTPLYKGQPSCT